MTKCSTCTFHTDKIPKQVDHIQIHRMALASRTPEAVVGWVAWVATTHPSHAYIIMVHSMVRS
jgi:predicted dithiol-disulfide oxidoreductase (DUF899 family)